MIENNYVQEIRLNQDYSHLYYSEFENNNLDKDATPIIKKRTLYTNDYIKRLISDDFDGGIMPPNCRYVEKLSKGCIVVIEEPPAMRTINLAMDMMPEYELLAKRGVLEEYGYKMPSRCKDSHRFTLAFPYVLFILYINEFYECSLGQVFVRPVQMSGLSDYICKIPLTNISESQIVCFGREGSRKQISLNTAIQNIIMVFWSAHFNTDYTYNYYEYQNVPILSTYLEWQYMSKANPMFIYNAEWIKYDKYRNLGGVIGNMKEHLQIYSKKSLGYKELADVFYTPYDSGVEIKTSTRGKRTQKLYYDICQGIYLNSNMYINVGDTIKMKNGEYAFIDSFAGFVSGGDIKYILLDHKGHKFHIKYSDASCKFLKKNIDEQNKAQEATIKNGIIVKPGDIISLKHGNNESYKKIKHIRKSRGEDNDIYELRMGSNYYLSHNVEATIFNLETPIIAGVDVKKNVEYIISKGSDYRPITKAGKYVFESVDINDEDLLVALFRSTNRCSSTPNYSVFLDKEREPNFLIPLDSAKSINNTFRSGRTIYTVTDNDENDIADPSVWIYNGIILYNNAQGNARLVKAKAHNLKQLLKDDTFSIEGSDFDTNFAIGDKVVVATWDDPLNMLNIKSIVGFKYDEKYANISFILMDKNENLSEILYVSGDRATVYTGKVRKVTNTWENLTVGTKIMAKEAGITAFPKQDVNIIVSIIIDGPHEPLVICSNGCTLWYSTVMNDFDHISIKSKTWAKLEHKPLDTSKIKLQTGDIINGRHEYKNREGYLLTYNTDNNVLKVCSLQHYKGSDDYLFTFDKSFRSDAILDCIPNPRISPTKHAQLGKIPGFYDFHGGISGNNPNSRYRFINERGEVK